ncbi:MAG TPA: fructose-bisphosphate aldolase, partial [Balneolaceae bacterium]|nr:fructose-bisphosphate aldolase [Balneolaceae bacterium]
MSLGINSIEELLGDEASDLLEHKCETISADRIAKPSASYVDDVWYHSDRNNRVLSNLQRLLDNGRLGGTGFLSILPVDQGIEHSAG